MKGPVAPPGQVALGQVQCSAAHLSPPHTTPTPHRPSPIGPRGISSWQAYCAYHCPQTISWDCCPWITFGGTLICASPRSLQMEKLRSGSYWWEKAELDLTVELLVASLPANSLSHDLQRSLHDLQGQLPALFRGGR